MLKMVLLYRKITCCLRKNIIMIKLMIHLMCNIGTITLLFKAGTLLTQPQLPRIITITLIKAILNKIKTINNKPMQLRSSQLLRNLRRKMAQNQQQIKKASAKKLKKKRKTAKARKLEDL